MTIHEKLEKLAEIAISDTLAQRGGDSTQDLTLCDFVDEVLGTIEDMRHMSSMDLYHFMRDYLSGDSSYRAYEAYLKMKEAYDQDKEFSPFNEDNPFFEPSTIGSKFTDIKKELIGSMVKDVDYEISSCLQFTKYGIEANASISFTNEGVRKILLHSTQAVVHIEALSKSKKWSLS